MKLLSTSWRSFAGEVQWLAVHWFKTKCSPKNLFNRFLEYSRKVFQPWHFVQIDDCSVKIRFWCGEKISPLFDMVAVWKGKAGEHAQWKIHRPGNLGQATDVWVPSSLFSILVWLCGERKIQEPNKLKDNACAKKRSSDRRPIPADPETSVVSEGVWKKAKHTNKQNERQSFECATNASWLATDI